MVSANDSRVQILKEMHERPSDVKLTAIGSKQKKQKQKSDNSIVAFPTEKIDEFDSVLGDDVLNFIDNADFGKSSHKGSVVDPSKQSNDQEVVFRINKDATKSKKM